MDRIAAAHLVRPRRRCFGAARVMGDERSGLPGCWGMRQARVQANERQPEWAGRRLPPRYLPWPGASGDEVGGEGAKRGCLAVWGRRRRCRETWAGGGGPGHGAGAVGRKRPDGGRPCGRKDTGRAGNGGRGARDASGNGRARKRWAGPGRRERLQSKTRRSRPCAGREEKKGPRQQSRPQDGLWDSAT